MSMADLPYFRDALQEAYDEVLSVGRQADLRPRVRARRTRRAANGELAQALQGP
jgi:hypothetical protein